MKIVVTVPIAFWIGASGLAQSRSGWVEDYGADAMKAAVAAGKTTVIYRLPQEMGSTDGSRGQTPISRELCRALVRRSRPRVAAPDMIPAEDRAVVNPTLEKLFVETRVTSILDRFGSAPPVTSSDSSYTRRAPIHFTSI